MKTPKVRLYIRVRQRRGHYAFLQPVWNRNHSLRASYALVAGEAEYHPEGCYYLRFLRKGKRIWQSVGTDADVALVSLRNAEHELKGISLGRSAPNLSAGRKSAVSLDDAIKSYLAEVRRFRAPKTIAACQHILTLFGSRFSGRSVQDITREDLLDHMSALQDRGLSQRTIYNHIMRIGTLLKLHKVVGLLSASDKPQYDEKDVEAYDSDQLTALFAAASPEERMLFQFFLGTGLREQEVMYTTWKNVDFKGKVVTVRSKPEMGFRIKDKEERSVPVPDALIASLTVRKRESTSMLVFPGTNGKPNGHFLRLLQHLAFRAGLNCGECVTKKGQKCSSHPVCSEWGLHKFRKSFSTMHSEAGVSAPTIQRWLGHADLATTLRYLAVADLRSERTRSQVNASFAVLNVGGAA